ncbi:MAG: tetratricopeptide repeat protein [Anaerolineae bacterium]|nr:tetratricopeptide repeat protein [Anaerolineae bacterium]
MNTPRALTLLLPLAMLILAVTACTLSTEPETILVSATPSTYEAPPASTVPYVTPTPLTVPTPTTPPDIALADAQLALKNGDYVSAVLSFQAVIDQYDINPAMQTKAAFGLGEAALREGLYVQAIAALTQFITQHPDSDHIPHAYFMRGDAYVGLGQWTHAIDDYNAYIQQRPGVIDSYAYERIGDAYTALGQPGPSLAAYAQAADAGRAVESLVALHERVAAGYFNAGEPLKAVEHYDAILAIAENASYRASIQYQAAQILLGAGDNAGGYTRLQTIIKDDPETYGAYLALADVLEAGLQISSYQRGLIRYANEDYAGAIQDFNTYTSETGLAPAEVLMMLGRAYREVGNTQAAITTFQTVLDTYPTDPVFGEAWLEQGRTLFLSGDIPVAIQRYGELATNYPDVPESAEALWRVGYLFSTQNDVENALSTFDILAQTYPGTDWAQEGLLLGAAIAANNGNSARAIQFYSQLASTGSGEYQARAYLAIGRLYQQDGKTDLARQAFGAAATADPGGYYSLRADDLLNGREPFQPPASTIFVFDEAAQLAEAEAWLRTAFDITQDGALYPLGDSLQNDPRLVRGTELMAVSAYDAAEGEFEALRLDIEDDPLAMYQLAIYLRDLGLYRLSIHVAASLITSAEIDTTQAPAYIARLRYPTYYDDLVIPECAENNLDPLLVFSLIRQESLYEGFATSYAAAQGLMQIIPDTGAWVAQQLQWPNYQNTDVYRPYINVKFGTFYLRWILDLDGVDGLPYVALAGYNGGPTNAVQWAALSGPDLDQFIQTISYDETQTYVRRIYEQYAVYRTIYGAP